MLWSCSKGGRFGIAVVLTALLCTGSALCDDQLTTIHLHPTATVASDAVTLKDIADVTDESPERIDQLHCVVLPVTAEPGQSATIDVMAVKQALAAADFHLAEIRFAGCYATTIHRETTVTAKSTSESKWGNVLREVLLQSIHNDLAVKPDEIEVTIEGRRGIEFLTQVDPEKWDLVLPEKWQTGPQSVTLEIPSPTGVSRFPLQVVIARRRQVVVATKQIPRGIKIEDDAVKLVSRTVATDNAAFATSLEQVVGKESTRLIDAHKVIERGDVQSPPLVFRGSRMTVHIRYRTASLEMNAIAGEDGGLGDYIEVINPTSKKPLQQKAKVVGLQTAELVDDSAAGGELAALGDASP